MRAGTLLRALVVACCGLAAQAAVASAAPGDLDRSFGVGGLAEVQRVFPDSEHTLETAVAMAVQPGGKIVVLSRSPRDCALPSDCEVDLAVTRYEPQGGRDMSFGSGGRFTLAASPPPGGLVSEPQRSSLAVGPGGEVVVAVTHGSDIAIVRLTPDGAPDPTFGGTGTVIADFGGVESLGKVTVQEDGAILVVGERTLGGSDEMILARYLTNGSPDSGFGSGGLVTADIGDEAPRYVAPFGEGKIAVGFPAEWQVSSFLASGAPDLGFGRQGSVRLTGGGADSIAGVLTTRIGKVIVVWTAHRGRNLESVRVMRFEADGEADRTFNNGSPLLLGGLHVNARAGAAIDGTGRLVIAGDASSEDFTGVVVRRLNLNGSPDRKFAAGRTTGFELGNDFERGVGLGLQGVHRIVVLGEESSCETVCYPFDPSKPPRAFLGRFVGGESKDRCRGRKATIVGTRLDESLVGTPRRDVFAALAGDDTIVTRGGGDLVCGGSGRDRVIVKHRANAGRGAR